MSPKKAPAEASLTPGMVSVVLVNYKGSDDTIACLEYCRELEPPAGGLELIVVENHSEDGSAERIRLAVPDAVVLESPTNTGFAGGCNFGVKHAHGQYVAFLNNDARPDTKWLTEAVAVLESDSTIGCVASKVLDWDGERVDYVDGSLTWYGMGYKREAEAFDSGEWDEPKDVLFGTGAAMIMPTALYRSVGGFDERFFMFYEDVDLGWRLNILGYRVRYVPTSIAYHRHHATMNKFGNFREAYLLERNALLSLYKNYDDEHLAVALPAAMALAVRRGIARGDMDASVLDLQRSPGGDEVGTLEVPKMALTGALAVDDFVRLIPSLAESRAKLQGLRRRSDRAILPLFRQPMEPAYAVPSYLQAHQDLAQAFGIDALFSMRHRVLVVTGEPLSDQLAGPAIRAWEIASLLSKDHDVHLVSTTGAKAKHPHFKVIYASPATMNAELEWADVIIFQGFLLLAYPWLVDSDKVIVADIYDPIHLEQLEQAKDLDPVGRLRQVDEVTEALNEQIKRADLLLCASEKQRDFWLGQLAGMGRLNPATYDEDPSLRSLLAVVPFGIPAEKPVQGKHGIRGQVKGIGQDDKIILWGGGIYNWFDPLTLIRAVAKLAETHPEVRLYFMGTKHPNPLVPEMRIAWQTRELAGELGLLDRHVFFNDGWVPYAERADYLMDADVGVSTHYEHIETAFSFRTRILDYIWTSLPIVATDGDTFSDVIRKEGMGRIVPPEDVDALAEALEEMLYDADAAAQARANVTRVSHNYEWPVVLEPLVEFSRFPRRAADRGDKARLAAARDVARNHRASLGSYMELSKQLLRGGYYGEFVHRAARKVRASVSGR